MPLRLLYATYWPFAKSVNVGQTEQKVLSDPWSTLSIREIHRPFGRYTVQSGDTPSSREIHRPVGRYTVQSGSVMSKPSLKQIVGSLKLKVFCRRQFCILNRKRNFAQKNTILNSPYTYTMKFWCSGNLMLLNFLWWVPTPCVAVKTCNLKKRNKYFIFHILWSYKNCDISFAVQYIWWTLCRMPVYLFQW